MFTKKSQLIGDKKTQEIIAFFTAKLVVKQKYKFAIVRIFRQNSVFPFCCVFASAVSTLQLTLCRPNQKKTEKLIESDFSDFKFVSDPLYESNKVQVLGRKRSCNSRNSSLTRKPQEVDFVGVEFSFAIFSDDFISEFTMFSTSAF